MTGLATIGGMQQHVHAQRIVMVCVTRQKTCERLIAEGHKTAQRENAILHIVHAVKTGESFLGNAFEGEALEYLFTAAQLADGDLTVLRADDVEATLAEYAKVHDATVLILGHPPAEVENKFQARMQQLLPDIQIMVV